jgi:hypothetical protein
LAAWVLSGVSYVPGQQCDASTRAALARCAEQECLQQANILRDILGPLIFRSVAINRLCVKPTVLELSNAVVAERGFERLPILADALEESGCDDPDILAHCRGPGEHVCGCWVIDLILGKE